MTENTGNINDLVNQRELGKYARKLIMFDRPILKSIMRRYEHTPYFRNYNLTPQDAEYMAVMNHHTDMRKYYEKLYLPKINIYMMKEKDETKNESPETSEEDGDKD